MIAILTDKEVPSTGATKHFIFSQFVSLKDGDIFSLMLAKLDN